jgi:hypothetical protein
VALQAHSSPKCKRLGLLWFGNCNAHQCHHSWSSGAHLLYAKLAPTAAWLSICCLAVCLCAAIPIFSHDVSSFCCMSCLTLSVCCNLLSDSYCNTICMFSSLLHIANFYCHEMSHIQNLPHIMVLTESTCRLSGLHALSRAS